jgi:hypothetical protein
MLVINNSPALIIWFSPIIVNVVYDHQVNKKLSREILAECEHEHQWMLMNEGYETLLCYLSVLPLVFKKRIKFKIYGILKNLMN